MTPDNRGNEGEGEEVIDFGSTWPKQNSSAWKKSRAQPGGVLKVQSSNRIGGGKVLRHHRFVREGRVQRLARKWEKQQILQLWLILRINWRGQWIISPQPLSLPLGPTPCTGEHKYPVRKLTRREWAWPRVARPSNHELAMSISLLSTRGQSLKL